MSCIQWCDVAAAVQKPYKYALYHSSASKSADSRVRHALNTMRDPTPRLKPGSHRVPWRKSGKRKSGSQSELAIVIDGTFRLYPSVFSRILVSAFPLSAFPSRCEPGFTLSRRAWHARALLCFICIAKQKDWMARGRCSILFLCFWSAYYITRTCLLLLKEY